MKDLHTGKHIMGLLSLTTGNADCICCADCCTNISDHLALSVMSNLNKLSLFKPTINSDGVLVNIFKQDLIPTTS